MAYKVSYNLPDVNLSKTDVEFRVWADGEMLGRLLVSKGAVVWRPRNKSKKAHKLRWRDFANLMETHGREVRGS